MPAKPATRAGIRPRRILVWLGNCRVSFWWRGPRRGISLPSFEFFDLSGSVPRLLSFQGEGTVIKPSAAAVAAIGAEPGQWGKSYPDLCEWLCRSSYPDGSMIGSVQLQMTRQGNVVRATLKIQDQGGLRVSAIGPSPHDALKALDLLLKSETCPWETDSYALGKGTRKK